VPDPKLEPELWAAELSRVQFELEGESELEREQEPELELEPNLGQELERELEA
jgi:hypothetical protein